MIQATLNEDTLWQGTVYEKGDRLIPEDLAAALGLSLPESGEVSAHLEPAATKPKTRRKTDVPDDR